MKRQVQYDSALKPNHTARDAETEVPLSQKVNSHQLAPKLISPPFKGEMSERLSKDRGG